MADDFTYDVFLSHSAKDKEVVRPLAERLRADGLRVWFDEWEIRPGDSIPARIEEGLERSRVLVLCMSAQAFGSDWAQLEAGTFRFRDPLNKERRFIPLRLDEAALKGPLTQFSFINWAPEDREHEYAKLLEACRPPAKPYERMNQTGKEYSAVQSGSRPDFRRSSFEATVNGPKIFISYRRGRSATAIAGRLYDHLVQKFGDDSIFFDVDTIPFGIAFDAHIIAAIEQSSVMLALISYEWLGIQQDGKRRIDEPNDFVRTEIEAALSRGIPIIPIIVDDLEMSDLQELPESLRGLTYLNAAPLGVGRGFRQDVERIIGAISLNLDALKERPSPSATATVTQRINDYIDWWKNLYGEDAIWYDSRLKGKMLALEVIACISRAEQKYFETPTTDDGGNDLELEFSDNSGRSTGKRLYLVLKAGDSHLRIRKKDGAELFTIKKQSWVASCLKQRHPVMLVIGRFADRSEGQEKPEFSDVRWMEIGSYLKRESQNGTKPVKQIVFEGERFDVMSVRRWRDRMLATTLP